MNAVAHRSGLGVFNMTAKFFILKEWQKLHQLDARHCQLKYWIVNVVRSFLLSLQGYLEVRLMAMYSRCNLTLSREVCCLSYEQGKVWYLGGYLYLWTMLIYNYIFVLKMTFSWFLLNVFAFIAKHEPATSLQLWAIWMHMKITTAGVKSSRDTDNQVIAATS